jgi:alkylation response protein AidB-like acyl-CoA dehydrogenase
VDFDTHYTAEQEALRVQVRGWLDQMAPKGLDIPLDRSPLTHETQQQLRRFLRDLGAKGWLAPSWPKEIGGGGMDKSFEVVIREEINSLNLPSVSEAYRWIPSMMVWGTQEQRLEYVLPALRGEIITCQAFSEPNAGTHLASIKTKAVQDREEYVISGVKGFVTGSFDPDYLWTLAVTNENRPLHFNLGIFMINAHLPGVTLKTQRLLMGSERIVYLNEVRVRKNCLIGTPYVGWEIAQTMLEQERGGFSSHANHSGTIESVMQYLREERSRS